MIMTPVFLQFPYILILIWAAAGLASAFVLPKIRPYLFYLAVYFALALSFSWTVYIVHLRGVFFRQEFLTLTHYMLILLPWVGILLALWWRTSDQRPVQAAETDPLWKRLALFGGIAILYLVLLVGAEHIFALKNWGLRGFSLSITENMTRYHLPGLLSVAVVLALLVLRLKPVRLWLAIFAAASFLLYGYRYILAFIPSIYRGMLPFSAYYYQLYYFLPFVFLLVAFLTNILPRRKV